MQDYKMPTREQNSNKGTFGKVLAVVGSTADDGIKPKVDACGADGILVDLCHKVVDQFIIQAVGALQDGLRMVKKAL